MGHWVIALGLLPFDVVGGYHWGSPAGKQDE
jgi:hypothetical protein